MLAPGAFAVLILMLEDPAPELAIADYIKRRFPFYIFLMVVGLLGGLLSQFISTLITHNAPFLYFGSMQHPLILDRLFPNPTYPPGILLGLLVLVGPLVIWLAWFFSSSSPRLNIVTRVLIVLLGIILFLGAAVVSLKIGGGGDLHHADMFLIFLLILVNESVRRMMHGQHVPPESWSDMIRALATYALLSPILVTVLTVQDSRAPPPGTGAQALETIRQEVEVASAEGEVLFLEQRQLLTFGLIEDVPLVSEYELVEVMDHAMAADEDYFRDFYRDLEDHRFSLIVAGSMDRTQHREKHPFEEENEAWRTFVSLKLLDLYSPAFQLDEVGVWLYKPIADLED